VLKAKAMDPMAPIALKVPVAVVSWMPKSLAGVVLPAHTRRCQLSEETSLRFSAISNHNGSFVRRQPRDYQLAMRCCTSWGEVDHTLNADYFQLLCVSKPAADPEV